VAAQPAAKYLHACCPVCTEQIPVLTVTVETRGFWKRRHEVFVEGDASDYVLHLWLHDIQKEARESTP